MSWVNLLDAIYPVGSVYISTINTSPASIVGGVWTQIEDAVLRGISGGETGYVGSDTHTMTVEEMPSHNHYPPVAVTNGGNAGNFRSLFATNSDFWSRGDVNNAVTRTGGNQAFSIVQRSYNVYVWYRTA